MQGLRPFDSNVLPVRPVLAPQNGKDSGELPFLQQSALELADSEKVHKRKDKKDCGHAPRLGAAWYKGEVMKPYITKVQIRKTRNFSQGKVFLVGQITVPKLILKKMNWKKGTRLKWSVTKRGAVLRRAKP